MRSEPHGPPPRRTDREHLPLGEPEPPNLWTDEALRAVLDAALRKDWALAGLADRQWGNATRAQALAAGVGPGAIQGRVERGYLHRVHRGVYRVGHTAPLDFNREMAAVLAYGTRRW